MKEDLTKKMVKDLMELITKYKDYNIDLNKLLEEHSKSVEESESTECFLEEIGCHLGYMFYLNTNLQKFYHEVSDYIKDK